jgi:2-C-methyl-D-erythritol 4-phosphate cytidylyltransferase
MLTVCIQAGGQSSRMGEDKALKTFLGRPLIQRVVDRLSSIADEMIVTTNRPEEYAFLKLPLFPDLKPGRGASPRSNRQLRQTSGRLSPGSHRSKYTLSCPMKSSVTIF